LAPAGARIDPGAVGAGRVLLARQDGIAYYRCGLPAVTRNPLGSHSGLWHVVLRLSRKTKDALPRFVKALRQRDPQLAQTLSQGVVPYDLIIHSQTNL